MSTDYETVVSKFDAWMEKVDAILSRKYGVSSDDMIDCCYGDWFEDGYTPSAAAKAAVAGQ